MLLNIIEIILDIITIFLFTAILATPIFVYRYFWEKGIILVLATIINIAILAIFSIIFTYWTEELIKEIKLNLLGFKWDNENYFENVKSENLNKVTEIYESMIGIGWPLKAIFSYIFLLIPYNFIILLGIFILKKYIK